MGDNVLLLVEHFKFRLELYQLTHWFQMLAIRKNPTDLTTIWRKKNILLTSKVSCVTCVSQLIIYHLFWRYFKGSVSLDLRGIDGFESNHKKNESRKSRDILPLKKRKKKNSCFWPLDSGSWKVVPEQTPWLPGEKWIYFKLPPHKLPPSPRLQQWRKSAHY